MRIRLIFLLISFYFLAEQIVLGQELESQGQMQSIESILNPDGTLNLTSWKSGSFDPKGFAMSYGNNDQPIFQPFGTNPPNAILSGDENWDDQFGSNGPNVTVEAIAISGNNVYVGGWFSSVGGISVNRITRWDGSNWNALGNGVASTSGSTIVRDIAVDGNDVYVAGRFNIAGGVSAENIARWDGSNWNALGTGTNYEIYAIAISNNDIYVGGELTTAGGVSANKIARWDGNNWNALGSGVSGNVWAITVSGSDVYVGGEFNTAGGVSANNVARWDGNNWNALGTGANSSVYSIAINGSDVYICGNFWSAGGIPADHIARWDGNNWNLLGFGVNATAKIITVSGSDVYVGGTFSSAGGISTSGIARWDGNNWNTLGSGTNGEVRAIASSGNDVYIGGTFSSAGGKPSTRFGRYSIFEPTFQPTNLSFSNITGNSLGVSFSTSSVEPSDGYLAIRRAGSSPTFIPIDGITYLTGQSVGNGTIVFTGSSTNFNETGLVPNTEYFYDIFAFNGSGGTINYLSVNPLEGSQSTFNNPPVVVNPIADQTYSEDFAAFTIANLDTVFFDADPSDTLSFSVVSQLGLVTPAINGSDLELTSVLDANGTDTLFVTATDLSSASVTDTILVSVLAVNDAPSTFALLTPTDGDSLLVLADPIDFVWNSATDVDNSSLTYTLRIFDTNLDTTFANLSDTSFTFSGGILDELTTYEWFVEVSDGQLTTASADTFEFHTPQAVGIGILENLVPENFSLEQNYPNPFNPTTTIKFGIPESAFTKVVIFNVLGQEVKTLVNENLEASFYEFRWNGTDNRNQVVSSGIYFYRIQSGSFVKVKKMVFNK